MASAFALLTAFGAESIASDVVWSDDSVPVGAAELSDGGDSWNWISSNPSPFSGALAHQSSLSAGLHEQFFNYASVPLAISTGDVLYTYVYIDPANPPSELMLSWNTDSWEHRAYWGANLISYGTNGTNSCRYMGPVPAAGQWVLLEVPASQVGMEGQSATGMGFSLYGGRVTWDKSGDASSSSAADLAPGTPATTDSTWFDDAIPAGSSGMSDGGDGWNWISSNPAPYSGTLAHQSNLSAGLHEHFFNYASVPFAIGTGDVLFTYVYIDPANPPSELMLSWNTDTWEHRAYWGANLINYGTNGTNSCRYMGPVPAAGQWIRLEVPASQVGTEGQGATGMGFSLYDGRATWDDSGKASTASATTASTASTSATGTTTGSTGTTTAASAPAATGSTTAASPAAAPATSGGSTTGTSTTPSVANGATATTTPVSNVDDTAMQLPKPGDNLLHVLSPQLLELIMINTKQPDPAQVSSWNLVNSSGQVTEPSPGDFSVIVDGKPVTVQSVGFKRRVLSAPLKVYDLRIENSLFLQLSTPVADGQSVSVTNVSGALWSGSTQFSALVDPLRYSPAIHVSQEGYVPSMPKKAMVGYYLGDMGEMPISATGFNIVDALSGAVVFQGSLSLRQDVGYETSPLPYQKVYMADFSAFTTPGEYQLQVAGMGASLPFVINDGIAMGFARTYALGIYEQRSGTATTMPFTRFTHGADHTAPAQVPSNDSDPQFAFTWGCISGYASTANANNPAQTAPLLTSEANSLYPYVNTGTIDVSGGHFDAGDYSKYTANSAELIHYLVFSVDSIPGVASLDNLGIPESGDGIPDVLQEAKWEADFLSKMQDADGGFYFLVYPKDREYESNVLPEKGDSQVVWPKNTSVTAASVAALAEAASSPAMLKYYPQSAAAYMKKAQLGWQFLTNAIAKYGKAGAYQKITFYSDDWTHDDELAWAAAAMFVATGNAQYQTQLFQWFPNPADSSTFRWGWWRMSECWGNAIRTYAFAARSGRLPQSALDPAYLAACEAQVVAAGDDAVTWSKDNAYASPFPPETKAVLGGGWYFSLDQASDMAVAYQVSPKPAYIDGLVGAMNYEGGNNPVNVTYLTGLGQKRQRENVSQYAQNSRRILPQSGIPLGQVTAGFEYLSSYGSELSEISYPTDSGNGVTFPYYDRWSDDFNVTQEFITVNQARSFMATAFLATLTSSSGGAWTAPAMTINLPAAVAPLATPLTLSLNAPGLDLTGARVVWEARDQQPTYGPTFTFSPVNNGDQWVEAEVEWPDGRRAFATGDFQANSPVQIWIDDALPVGAVTGSDGGDSWNWISGNPTPESGLLAAQTIAAAGLHENWFTGASGTMQVATGDTLTAWVYLDPANPPSEIMVAWNDGSSWEHRAYWGANDITYGTSGTAGRYNAGALPATGQWVKLSVPASAVGLEGSTVSGLDLSLYDGRATWDAIGRASSVP